MYASLSNRLLATVIVCSLLLQGCRSGLRISDDDEPASKKARRTSHGEQVTGQEPPLAITLPPVATYTDQVASPEHRLAVRTDTVSGLGQASSKEEEADTNPPAQAAVDSSVLAPVFGAKEWAKYFGEVGEEPCLPSDIDGILDGPCPFWPGKRVKDTHLLVLMPSTVAGNPFSLDLLGELIQHPQGGGHSTEYRDYDSDLKKQFGIQSPERSYWVLMTRDMLEGSRDEPYASQQSLVAAHAKRTGLSYELPGALEAATAILSHYVRSGERLYTDAPWTWTRCRELVVWNGKEYPTVVGGFSSGGLHVHDVIHDHCNFGVAGLRKFMEADTKPAAVPTTQVAELPSMPALPFSVLTSVFGVQEWAQYFGEVGAAPSLPPDIAAILSSACPFWPGKSVKDTHLLVLIPATVNGEPFSLNLLRKLIQPPRGGGHSTKYRDYDSDLKKQFGTQSPGRAYWVLMTRDVLEGSRSKDYKSQQSLVAGHAKRTGLSYELPGALEAATAILSYYVRSGERLYTDAPWTWTRCRELVAYKGYNYPTVVGGFSSGGLSVHYFNADDFSFHGVAGLRKF